MLKFLHSSFLTVYFTIGWISEYVALQKAVIPLVAENDVVEQLDAEGFSGGFEFLGDVDVVFAGGDVAGGVVVRDDDGAGQIPGPQRSGWPWPAPNRRYP